LRSEEEYETRDAVPLAQSVWPFSDDAVGFDVLNRRNALHAAVFVTDP